MNHPNRSKRNPSEWRNPTPIEIKAARHAAGLTQSEAAHSIGASLRAWQQWEEGAGGPAGGRRMHAGLWKLFLLTAGLSTDFREISSPYKDASSPR